MKFNFKKKIFTGFLIVLLSVFSSACTSDESVNQGGNGIDYNQYVNGNGFFAYTDTAFLFYQPGLPIRFVDAGLTQLPQVLCTKPNCRHNSVDCSAYADTIGLYAYDNRLYYVSRGNDDNYSLYEMEPGGGNRRELFRINELSNLSSYGYTYVIGAGYLLLDRQRDTVSDSVDTLYLYPLKADQNTPVTVYEESGEEELIIFFLRKDWVFYSTAPESDQKHQKLYGYRISTQETTLLHDDWRTRNAISLKEDVLYFSNETENLGMIDLKNGEVTEFPGNLEETSGYYDAIYDDQHFYFTLWDSDNSYGRPGVAIYTYEGEPVQFVPIEGDQILGYCISGPDTVVFFDAKARNYAPVCYLKKAEIASGTAEFIYLDQQQ